MTSLESQWIAQTLGSSWVGTPPARLAGINFDSRLIKPGELFVALKGARHGHEFLQAAKEKGASGALVESHQTHSDLPQLAVGDTLVALQKLAKAHRKRLKGKVIALSGSSGKTSAKELIAQILGEGTHKTQGNFNNHIGLPLTLLQAPIEAPFVVLEAGISAAGEMAALADIATPDAATLTMIGSAHLEFFKTKQTTAREKGLLLSKIQKNGFGVLHAAEMEFQALRELPARMIILGATPQKLPAHYIIEPIAITEKPEGWELKFEHGSYELPLVTPGMARNAAIGIRLGLELGIEPKLIQARLRSLQTPELRGAWVKVAGSPHPCAQIYFDAYNCNPEALADALWRFHRLSDTNRDRFYVLGSMGELGDDSNTLHKTSAQGILLRKNDRAWLIGNKAEYYRQGLIQSGASESQITLSDDLEALKREILKMDADTFIKGSHSSKLYTLNCLCLAS